MLLDVQLAWVRVCGIGWRQGQLQVLLPGLGCVRLLLLLRVDEVLQVEGWEAL